MSGWFARLMQRGHARSHEAGAADGLPTHDDVVRDLEARDDRYDDVVQLLRLRETEDRDAREKRQRWYKQYVKLDTGRAGEASAPCPPDRLHRFRTKVPSRLTPEARALLDRLATLFPGSTVTFRHDGSGRQVAMLAGGAMTEPRQIGWVEHSVQTDASLCDVRHQGLTVETDGGTMLVFRFRYPPTPVRLTGASTGPEGAPDEASADTTSVDFAEIRPALDLRPADRSAPPRLTWLTRPELEMMGAIRNRDFEAFYVRFKLEVLAGIWSSLSAQLSTPPGSHWHGGAYYTVVREPDAAKGRIHQRTVDDGGRAVDTGADRVYDAALATDMLLLYLEGDILSDVADIYFTLRSVRSADAYFLKEELFRVLRRFWATAPSLASSYGSDLPTVVRLSQRAAPMPAQALLLKQDWINLRQSLVDRYGDRGRRAGELVGRHVQRPRTGPLGWPFATFPAGDVNVGVRLVYRQEWRQLGTQRGEVVRTEPRARAAAADQRIVETTIEPGDTTGSLAEVVADAAAAAAAAMKWARNVDGSIEIGARSLAATTDAGLESECRESSRDACARVDEVMLRMVSARREASAEAAGAEPEELDDAPESAGEDEPADPDAASYVYSRLQNRYEVLTRPAEIQNVVLVAEKLPAPAEIDVSWVRRYSWILSRVLLDESLRGALDTIREEAAAPNAERDRLCEHVRANILHYQRAIWQQEDPQQRSMRYRKSGRKVPLEWRFELESGRAMSVAELGDRLSAATVDGQFSAYASGRQVELDQVIDPSGPVGFYGNYAVYRMRPEFGGEDLFSMLHFFKSPYLRANAETGAPEVDDPARIRLSDAQFRRERTRRLALDTNGVVIDTVRRVVPALDLSAALQGFELMLDGGRAIEVRSGSGHSDAGADWRLAHAGATPALAAGAGAAASAAHEPVVITSGATAASPAPVAGTGSRPEAEPLVLPESAASQALVLRADPVHDLAAGRMILPRGPRLTAGAGTGVPGAHESAIVAGGGRRPAPAMRVGRAHDPAAERMILPRGPRLSAGACSSVPQAHERAIIAGVEQQRVAGLRTARAHDPLSERLILVRDEGAPRLTVVAGGGASHAHERAIVAGGAEWLRPSLIAG